MWEVAGAIFEVTGLDNCLLPEKRGDNIPYKRELFFCLINFHSTKACEGVEV
jgi:hypothetical protein